MSSVVTLEYCWLNFMAISCIFVGCTIFLRAIISREKCTKNVTRKIRLVQSPYQLKVWFTNAKTSWVRYLIAYSSFVKLWLWEKLYITTNTTFLSCIIRGSHQLFWCESTASHLVHFIRGLQRIQGQWWWQQPIAKRLLIGIIEKGTIKNWTDSVNQVWVSDTSAVLTHGRLYYICVYLDLFSRKVVAWRIGNNNSTQLVKRTFLEGYSMRSRPKSLVIHTDNGTCYTAYSYERALQQCRVSHSLSRAHIPHDNAVAESFFNTETPISSKVFLPYKHFLGYKKGADGYPEIVEEEAAIVRQIYDMFLSGKSIRHIADYLTEQGVPTPTGKSRWPVSTVENILRNEKYKGEALLQKSYTVDYLSKKTRKNDGELPQYHIENSHEPIISPEIFDLVQKKLEHRRGYKARFRDNSPLSNKLICADCGGFYGHKVWHNRENTKRYDIWYCNRRYTSAEKCKTPILRENEIEMAFERICKELGIRGGQSHENLWNEMVEVVMVYPDRRLIFHMIDGREAEVIIWSYTTIAHYK